MTTCINLREKFGRQYHVRFEESHAADRGSISREEAAWLMVMPCKRGHIFPHGGDLLAASVDGHSRVAAELARLKCCSVVQDGDFGELTATFDVGDFGAVARIMRPRRRRKVELTSQQRQAIGQRLRKGRATGQKALAHNAPTAQGRPAARKDDRRALGNQLPLFGPLDD